MDGECYITLLKAGKMSRENAGKHCALGLSPSALTIIKNNKQWRNIIRLLRENNISSTIWIDQDSAKGMRFYCIDGSQHRQASKIMNLFLALSEKMISEDFDHF